MPARTVQRVETVPQREWVPICLECCWTGPPTADETVADRISYDHNRDHHDGAGTQPAVRDLVDSIQSDIVLFRRMMKQCIGMALFSLTVAVLLIAMLDGAGIWNILGIGVNAAVGMLNAFLAGKWANRLERVQIEDLQLGTPGS